MTSFRALHDGWTLTAATPVPIDLAVPGGSVGRPGDAVPGGGVPATVPGCVHTDLLAAGLIDDPYLDDNENGLTWIGRTDWIYETTFEIADPESSDRVDLVCAGLDTVATVTLNGTELGRTVNMHRSYRFDVTHLLVAGDNQLRVRFDSAYRYAEAVRDAIGERPGVYPEPYQYLRKMACNFGWDWGPTLVTAGIWQSIGLETWSAARLAQVRPEITVTGGVGQVRLHVSVDRPGSVAAAPGATAGPAPVVLTATVAGRSGALVPRPAVSGAAVSGAAVSGAAVSGAVTIAPDADAAQLTVEVPDVDLWWPRGYGAQPRYDLTVTLTGADGAVLDTWQRQIGFRTVALDTSADSDGTRFTLVVNDVPIWVRGANWIPDDTFVTRVDRDRYATRLKQATEVGANLLRVWGGGRYESEDFYDLADEHGILVSQDFLFACSSYPEEEPLAGEVAAEAREQVVRLAGHPSLALWIGNNENFCGHRHWGWSEILNGRTWGEGYYHTLLPGIVAELDPTRPYWPGSPYSGTPDSDPDDPRHGSVHVWDVWNTHDYTHYRTWRPRFVAEFGFQGPPAYATLRRSISDNPLAPDSPGMMHHQKAHEGNPKLAKGLAAHLPPPRDFDDWHFATQLNQARAIQFGIEHFRSLRPLCMGTVMWQLNDCWPVTSWAAVDGDGRRKPLWYALRQAYADRLLTFQPRDGVPALVAVNESLTDWTTQLDVIRVDVHGNQKVSVPVELHVPAGGATTVALPAGLVTPDDPALEFLVATSTRAGSALAETTPTYPRGADRAAHRALWTFAEDTDRRYAEPVFTTMVDSRADGAEVTITAGTLLRDLTLFPDRLDPTAWVDDAMVTLLPGETTVFTVYADGPIDPRALVTRPVLRCANDLTTGS